MSIPTYEDLKIPALQLFSERQAGRVTELMRPLAEQFDLTEEDQTEVLPSGQETRWHNRVGWAVYDLFKAGLLERVKRGVYKITDLGKEVAVSSPQTLSRQALMQFPAFKKWFDDYNAATVSQASSENFEKNIEQADVTPEEQMAAAYAELRQGLVVDLTGALKTVDPLRFEQIVLDVLLAMGYGGSRAEAANITRATNDEGIDGVINEDRLGLDVIYVQAKRWQDNVGRKEIQSFVGALAGQQASKGIFITTSGFASTAKEYAKNVSQRVILIDGERLANLMIDHKVGVSVERAYEIKQMDSDYFDA